MNYLEIIKQWLSVNKAEIIISQEHNDMPAARLFGATVTCKKYKNPMSLSSLLSEIFDNNELVSVMTSINTLTNDDIDKFINTTDDTDKTPNIFYSATDKFNAFISRYILCTFSNDRKKVYMYKKYVDDRLISLHKLDDDLEDFFTQLEQDDRLIEFQESFVKEFNNDYEFFSQFCGHKLNSAGKQITDANGSPMLIQPDIKKFISDILPNVSFKKSPFPEVLSNDPNVAGFSNIYFDDLLSMKIGRIDTITEWLNSRFRPDQIDIIEKVIARSVIAHAPDLHGLYIYDPDGENGKSTLLNALAAAYKKLNIKCCNMTLSGIDDKHSYVQYFGASVAFNADVKSPNFIMTDLYHHVTGGDMVTIDPKGGMPFEANVKVTAILAGNIPIQFETDKNHMARRIFFIPMHKPSDEYIAKNTIMIDGKRVWKDQATFSKTIEEQAYDWMVNCFKKHYTYNLLENSIVQSDAMWEDTVDMCGENYSIEENLILRALENHVAITTDMNDYIILEDLYALIMNGTISVPQIKLSSPTDRKKVKSAILNEILKLDSIHDVKDICTRKLIKNKKRKIIRGIKLVDNANHVLDSLSYRLKKCAQNDLQNIAEEMGVGCDYAHINDAKQVTTDSDAPDVSSEEPPAIDVEALDVSKYEKPKFFEGDHCVCDAGRIQYDRNYDYDAGVEY